MENSRLINAPPIIAGLPVWRIEGLEMELDLLRANLFLLYRRAIRNMAPPYAPARAQAPTAIPTVLAFWFEEVLEADVSAKVPPSLLLPDDELLLLLDPEEPVELESPMLSPR